MSDASSVASTSSEVSDASSISAGAGDGVGAGGATASSTALEAMQALSLKHKNAGNEEFKKGHNDAAIEEYTKGIDCYETAVLYANRAAAYLKTESFGFAVADATKAVELDPKYAKGYYRRGSARMALGKLKEAVKDFKAVCKMKPKDKTARKKFTTCQKLARRKAFEEALQMDDMEPVSQTMNLDSMTVPADYTGPRLPDDGTITLEFVQELMQTFKDQGKLHMKYCIMLLKQVKELVRAQKSLVRITVPETFPSGKPGMISVCGDTHGQYYDLLHIFEMNGLPGPENMYLFNGDFVDRGSFSVENVLVLFALKLLYPEHMFLSRGNHETINMNKVYGFEGEVKAKFDLKVMAIFTEVFQSLPLAHLINDKVFVVHGGLPANTATTMKDVEDIARFREPPESGLMSDLLWSDPQPFQGVGPSKRGVGVAFGPDITAGFCKTNGLELVIRSHEVKDEGYLVEHNGKCITVFSAPNYCDQMGNKGALIRLTSDVKPEFVQFEASTHPPIRPMAYASAFGMFGL